MISYLLKLLLTSIVGIIIITAFYKHGHIENFDGYLPYIIFNGIIYLGYKVYTLAIDYKEKIRFSIFEIFSLFLLELGFFSWMFFKISSSQNAFLTLFFSIIGYLILPLTILIISYSFGEKIINFIEEKFSSQKEDFEFKFLMGLGTGITSFIMLLLILGTLGFYNLYSVFGILTIFGAFSYKELLSNLKNIFTYKFELENHNLYSNSLVEKINTKLISTEFLFLFISMLISVNFISIFRSSPIGWDDMGVYMNYPNIMAHSGNLALGQMISWQTLTGIGYMFDSPTQAFFLNNLGAILSTIVIIVSFSWFFKNKKTFINIGFLAASIFLAMPMVIFQQAKDMKLDIGLFAISSIAVFSTIYIFLKYIGYKCDVDNENIEKKSVFKKIIDYTQKCEIIGNNHLFDNKKYLIYLFLIGILSGFAFSIKATSLLLISGIIGIIAYSKLGFAGFLGYLSIFVGIFTKFRLWDYMGAINYPKTNSNFLNLFFEFALVIGLILFSYSINKYSLKNFKRFFLIVGIYLAGVFIILTPYFTKHLIEIKNSNSNISLGALISGKSDRFKVDYSKILSKQELQKIEEDKKQALLSASGTTKNEDLGRYFGYEKGINNYMKLPWNLTMQTNQGGEFTNITFIFLALIPVIFLFLRFKNKYFIAGILFILLLEFLTFYKQNPNIIPNSKIQISDNIKNEYFIKNNNVFKDSYFGDNIYKIKFNEYLTDNFIYNYLKKQGLEKNFQKEKNHLKQKFYLDLASKIKNAKINANTEILGIKLDKEDLEYAQKLSKLYNNYNILKIQSLQKLENKINSLEKNPKKTKEIAKKIEDLKNIEKIYKKYRTTNQAISDYFGKYTMPLGYSIILLVFLFSLAYILYSLKKDKESQIFRLTAIFMSFYTFLWTISAFGIIWYGITMFYALLILMGIGIFYVSYYEDNFQEKTKLIKNFGTLIIFTIIGVYFFNSSYPHSFADTLKKASWVDFKNRSIPGEDLVFLYSPDRTNVLTYLNIEPSKQNLFLEEVTKDIKDPQIKQFFEKIKKASQNKIINFKNILKNEELNLTRKIYNNLKESGIITQNAKITNSYQILKYKTKLPQNKELFNLLETIKKVEHNIYVNLLYPKPEFKSTKNIYRIGTFFKYFISDNTKRLFEDSLLTNYDTYIKTGNIDKDVENLKKLGLKYILFDLNAATIDNDPRHALTKRYEDLLKLITSDKLKLLETDSICLKVALETYKKDYNLKQYLQIAGVNYDSYDKNNHIISRNVKKNICANFILKLKKDKKINAQNYSYLQTINNLDEKNTINYIKNAIGGVGGRFGLVEIK